MIIYDLSCSHGHRFEGWFPNQSDFDAQREKGLLSCQVCGDTSIEKILTGGRYLRHDSHRTERHAAPAPAENEETRPTLTNADLDPVLVFKAINHYVKTHFEDVGPRFAETVRSMHNGDEPRRDVYGQATPEERERLEEEGIPHVLLPDVDKPEFNH